MTDFDPTTNRIPFVLLKSEEQEALKDWPHGFEFYQLEGWCDCPIPFWEPRAVYRGKPAPVVEHIFAAVYPNGFSVGYKSFEDVLAYSTDRRIGYIRAEIVDGKLKDVRVVKGEDET